MARIRTIKPQIWTSEQFVECSLNARLMFIGLFNFCDDNGIHPLSYKSTKMQVFPGDDFTTDDICRMYEELQANGLIHTYTVNNKDYFIITGWHHQKIDKPNYSHPLPECYEGYIRQNVGKSNNSSEPVVDQSSNDIPRNGMDSKGKEDIKDSQHEQSSRSRQNPSVPYQKIWDLYKKHLNGNSDHNLVEVMTLTEKRKTKMKKLWVLSNNDLEQVERYFEWLYKARNNHQWIFGFNNRSWVADIEYICREDTYTKAQEGRLGDWEQAA